MNNNNKKERKQQEQQRHSNSEITLGTGRKKQNIGDSKISFWREKEFEEGAVRLFRGAEASAGMRLISEWMTEHGNLFVQLDTCLHWFFNSSHGLFSFHRWWCDEHFFLSWANREMCCEIEIDRLIDWYKSSFLLLKFKADQRRRVQFRQILHSSLPVLRSSLWRDEVKT